MKLGSLQPGWRTDFIVHRFDAQVFERDDCIVVRTPANPTFYWGNFLLLPEAPRDDQLGHWCGCFEAEISAVQPTSRHVAIGVNAAPVGLVLPAWQTAWQAAWQAAGFEFIVTAVMCQRPGELLPPARAPRGEVVFRALDLEHEAEAVVALQCVDSQGFEPAGYAEYTRRQMRRYQAMSQAGMAAWFGLWCDGVLAADCGLIRDATTRGASGRFQRVATHPAWRRRGLCRALVHGVTAWGFQHWGLGSIIMCADPHDVAIGIYASLGYRRIGQQSCLQRYAPGDEAARHAGGAA